MGAHDFRFDHSPLRCPSCGRRVAGPAGASGRIVCSNCGETWPRAGALVPHRPAGRPVSFFSEADSDVIEAVHRPLVSYSAVDSSAVWRARMLADEPFEPRRRIRGLGLAAALASLLVIGGFFGAREQAVAAVPDLAGLYAAIGLPVNVRHLDIVQTAAWRKVTPAGTILVVSGEIVNGTSDPRPVPAVRIGVGAETRDFSPPVSFLEAGASTAFQYQIPVRSPVAGDVTVRFAGAGRLPARPTESRSGT